MRRERLQIQQTNYRRQKRFISRFFAVGVAAVSLLYLVVDKIAQ